MKLSSIIGLVVLSMSSLSLASGYRCEGEEGFRLKVYNHVNPDNGTRTPAALILSSTKQGTLLTRRNDEIRKKNQTNAVRYVVDGQPELSADYVIVHINHLEGKETLEEGEVVQGHLIFVQDEDRKTYRMECERYLASENLDD